jgi:hypothetical protein
LGTRQRSKTENLFGHSGEDLLGHSIERLLPGHFKKDISNPDAYFGDFSVRPGEGRKWGFSTRLSALVLVGVGAVGISLYGYVTDRVAERRTQKNPRLRCRQGGEASL